MKNRKFGMMDCRFGEANCPDLGCLRQNFGRPSAGRLGLFVLMLLAFALVPNGVKAQYNPVVWYTFDNAPYGQNVVGPGNDFFVNSPLWIGGDSPVVDSFMQVNDVVFPPLAQAADSGRVFNELTVEFWFRRDRPFFSSNLVTMLGNAWFELSEQAISWVVVTEPAQYWRLDLPFYGAGAMDVHNVLDGEWHHFAGTFDVKTGTQKLYIDGRNAAGMTLHHGTTSAMATSFGFIPYPALADSIGDLDEIAFYDTVLPPDLVWQHYFNGLQGLAYAANVNPLGPFAPTPQNVAQGGIDTLEFCPGYPATPVGTPELLGGYPAPRYRPGHGMPRLIPWFNDSYNIANNLPVGSFGAGGPPMMDMLRRLATDYNYYLYLGGTKEYFNPPPNSQVQFYAQAGNLGANLGLPRFAVNNWRTVSPRDFNATWDSTCEVLWQSLPNVSYYLRNLSGQPYLGFFGTKRWNWQAIQSPTDPRLQYIDRDGVAAANYLGFLNSAVPYQLDMIGENEETLIAFDSVLVDGDPDMVVDHGLSGLSVQDYNAVRSRDFRRRFSNHYVNYQNARPWQQDSVQLYWYNVGGNLGYSHFLYDTARAINRFSDGVPRGTGAWYPETPARWRYGAGPVTGFREVVVGRRNEILAGDRRFMPPVSPGFSESGGGWFSNDREMLRPGQFLGSLKALGMMGADGYAMYMTHGDPVSVVPMQGSWRAWQPAMPAYAQAVTDRLGALLGDGYLLDGDMGGVANWFMFSTGNPLDLVVGRKHEVLDRYAVHGSIMRLVNNPSHAPKEKDAVVALSDSNGLVIDTLMFKIRAQGSTYILDMTGPDTVFYQLDGWHEWTEPWRWCRDFTLEGELADTVVSGAGVIGTEHVGAAGDYREFTSWMRIGNGDTLRYEFVTRHADQDTLHVWVRARWTQPGNNALTVVLGGAPVGSVPVVGNGWGWNSVPVVLPSLGIQSHDLGIVSNHNGIEVDKVVLARSAQPFWAVTPVPAAMVEDSVVCLGDSALFHGAGKYPAGCLDYRWDFGDGNFAYSADPGHLYAYPDTYQVVLSVAHQCLGVTVLDTVTVVVDAPHVEAGRDTFMCSGDTMVLQGAGSYFYTWREDSLVSSQIVPSPSAWPTESGYFHIDGWDPISGCHASDSVYVTLLGQPPVPDTTYFFCANPPGLVQIGIPAGLGQYWAWWEADSLIDSISGHFAWVNVDSNYTFTAYVSDFCRCDTDTVRISVEPILFPITAFASQDTVCEGTPLTLFAQGVASTTNLVWTGLLGLNQYGGLVMTAQGNPVVALPPALGSAAFSPQDLFYVVTGTSCPNMARASDTVHVVLVPTPHLDGWQDTVWVCDSVRILTQPNATYPQPNSWAWTPAAVLGDTTSDEPYVNVTLGGPTVCTVVVNSNLGCPNSYSTVLMPMGLLVDSVYHCPGDGVGVGVSAALGLGTAINVAWSPGQFFADSTAPVTTVSVPLATQVTVIYNYPGCLQMYDTILVIPHGLPEVVGPDTLRGCAGDTVSLSVGVSASPVQWGLSGLSVGDSTSPVTWTVCQSTPFTLYVASLDSFFCAGFDSVLVTWLDAIALDSVDVCLGDTVVVPGMGGGVSCVWSPLTDVVSTAGCTLVAVPMNDRWYYLEWTDSAGCFARDSVWVNVDSVSLTGNLVSVADTICLGDSVQLLALGGTVYGWSPVLAAVGSPWAVPSVTTTYTVAISNGGACVVEDSVEIVVDQAGPVGSLNASADTVCRNTPVVLTATGGGLYSWSGPGIGGLTTSTVNLVATSSATYFVRDGGACVWQDSVLVVVDQGCCYLPVVDTMLSGARMRDLVAWNGGNNFSNRHWYLQDTLWVDTAATIRYSVLEMGASAKVMVMPGADLLSIQNHWRSACGDTVWAGIHLEGLTAKFTSKFDTIEEADIAITSRNGGVFVLNGSVFRRSRIHLKVLHWDIPHLGSVAQCTFEGGAIPYPYQSLVAPESGVDMEEVRLIEIGQAQLGTPPNLFTGLRWGIKLRNSVALIRNNAFKSLVTTLGTGEPGTAIHCKWVAVQGYTGPRGLLVGDTVASGAADYLAANSFSNCRNGVWVTGNYSVQAYGNKLEGISNVGLRVQGTNQRLLRLEENRIENAGLGIGVHLVTSPVPGSRVHGNVITQTASDTLKGIRLDQVTHPLLLNNDSTWGMAVSSNRVAIRGECIWVQSSDHVNVQDNNVFMHGNTAAMVDRAMFVAGCENIRIFNNELQSQYGRQLSDTLYSGIFVAMSPQTTMRCNWVHDFGRDVVWEDVCMPSKMLNNELGNAVDGLVLQFQGQIGPQGSYQPSPLIEIPSDNRWQNGVQGYYRWQTVALEAQGVNSQFYVRDSPNFNPPHNWNYGAGSSPILPDSSINPNASAYQCRDGVPNDPKGGTIRGIATNRIAEGPHQLESQFRADAWAFKQLLIDSTLMTGDSLISSFFDSLTHTNLGKLSIADIAISRGDSTEAANQLAAVTGANSYEQNEWLAILKRILAMGEEFEGFTPAEIGTLQMKALECPRYGGKAVYTCRSLLTTDGSYVWADDLCVGADSKMASEAKETFNSELPIVIWPNPAGDRFQIKVPHSTIAPWCLKVTNVTSQCVYNASLTNSQTEEVVTRAWPSGVYFLDVGLQGGTVWHSRVVVVH